MKSWQSHDEIRTSSDEIFSLRLQMKLNPPHNPAIAGFHREAISSTEGGFLPTKADLVGKSRGHKEGAFNKIEGYQLSLGLKLVKLDRTV